MPTCARHGIGIVVWSPLAQGLLTGKYNDSVPAGTRGETMLLTKHINETNIEKVKKLAAIAEEIGITVGQLALAWIEISCAIIGVTHVEQLQENLAATDVQLSESCLQKIEAVLGEKRTTRFRM